MPKVYTWHNKDRDEDRIAVGEDSIYATVYIVYDDYRRRTDDILGNLLRFGAVDRDSFDGPFEMTLEEIDEKYGPVKTPEQVRKEIFNPDN